ncbi:isocitrate dehydrogenase [NAD] subunit beta, mitochondrial-like, partial [Cyanistes caeruleus]|uniref:isocitrate dehydrogenase [NAD] subunit beta, mitochondrial-like n=1 Tax=Cyanistes caeruleus TaxID=156563 RepID=UPI000CDA42C2
MLPGDGVGPELMHAVKEVFKAGNVPVIFDEHHLSEVQNTASEEKLDRVVDSMKESKVALIGEGSVALSLALSLSLVTVLVPVLVPCHCPCSCPCSCPCPCPLSL